MKSLSLRCCAIALFLAVASASAVRADWPRFLGPEGNNVSPEKGLPTNWSATENVAWKTALPGPGSSSPIVLGDRVYLTAYSGYGVDPKQPGEVSDLRYHVLCIDRNSGEILWDKSLTADGPVRKYNGYITQHGYASSTLATDGVRLFAFFGTSGVYCFTLDGAQEWHVKVGDGIDPWGSAASPILLGDLLIVNASVESGTLVALNKLSSEKVWTVDGVNRSWSTPGILTLADGKQEVVVSAKGGVRGIDPAKGAVLWTCEGIPDYAAAAVVTHGDVAFAANGLKPFMLAVRGGGRGDVTATHKLWEIKQSPRTPSPIFADGLLYWASNRGDFGCIQPESGKEVFADRIPGLKSIYATALLADGKWYVVSRDEGVAVLAGGRTFKALAHNDLGDTSVFNATPVADRGQLLLRSDAALYCIGK